MEKFAGNFRRLDVCDVSAIRERVAALSDAQTFELIYCKDIRYETPARMEMYDELDCGDRLAPVIETIADYFTGEGFISRALLVRLRAGGRIHPHVHSGYPLMESRRIHIPLLTNSEVYFTVGGESRAMAEGELWEIDNARTHGVENTSDQSRVHLIIDWVTS